MTHAGPRGGNSTPYDTVDPNQVVRNAREWAGEWERIGCSVQATGRVRHLGGNPLKLRGFHDLSQLLWFEHHRVLSTDNRISMLTQAKIAPVITFVIKRRPLEEHLVHHAIRVRRLFIAVMTLP